MKEIRMKNTILLILIFSIIQGCATYDIQANKSKHFPPSQEMKIAILPFIAPAPQTIKNITMVGEAIEVIPENAGISVADSIASAMIGIPNIVLIERSQLEKILNEHKLSLLGVVNNPDFLMLGKILPVDALVLGNITLFHRFNSRGGWGATVAYTGRMVNIRSGEVLFTINCNTVQNYVLAEKLADDLARDAIKKLLEK
jgi:curli biogenesis system outer membrane secretion channel CsgG